MVAELIPATQISIIEITYNGILGFLCDVILLSFVHLMMAWYICRNM
jgi:hypothetical protein